MLRMYKNSDFWSYFWSAITGFFAMLTLLGALFAACVVVTTYFIWLSCLLTP